MINLEEISLAFGQQVIFDKISCNINPGQKIGLVGRNGSGKTTLLKVIAGQQSLDSGQVTIAKSFRWAFMPQDVVLVSEKTILNEALNAFAHMGNLLDELADLEHYISHNSENDEINERYVAVHHQLYEMNYDSKRAEAEKMLVGLGFLKDNLENLVESLSVGWKMRLILAKLLLQKADFYLFDEPTNHLDLFAKDWFVDFLRNATFGFILVAHDEYFLNNVCKEIFEISRGKIKTHKGSYNSYLVQKEADEALLEKKYEEQKKLIKKKQAVIERFRYKASKARMAQSMIKSLEKVEKVERDHQQKNVRFNFTPVSRSGKIVLDVKNLSFSFGQKQIFNKITFNIMRGKKMAIVASNGTGKSTLLNVIMGKYKQDSGSVSFGHNVKPVFFEQDQNKSLNANNEIIQEIEQSCKTIEQRSRVRGSLGAFLFTGDDVYKKIKVLSGGEKNRVAMVKILLEEANFLILDEPTNHLDIVSKNILLKLLSDFNGTILFVSHDRTFLNSLATDIIELTSSGVETYGGNYDDYLYYKQHRESIAKPEKSKAKAQVTNKEQKRSSDNMRELRKKLRNIESAIAKLEKKITQLEGKFATISYGTAAYDQTTAEWRKSKQELKEKNALWEQLVSDLD